MTTQDRNRAKIAKAALYIEENLSAPMRASDIAEHAHLSSFHFQRLFCAYMGEPVNQYIIARRLEAAALQLSRHPDTNLLELALDCGFQTHSAFSRAFKVQFGVSPSTFRETPTKAHVGLDLDRRFLLSAPPSQTIQETEIVELEAFQFQYRQSKGTLGGQFFSGNDDDVGRQFSELFTLTEAPDLFVMSCFPNTPQNLNDETVPVWYGGACSSRSNNGWSDRWHQFEAGQWAVFEHWGEYRFLYQTWNQIYRNWLPATRYALRNDLPFETYLGSGQSGNEKVQLTRIYIPVKKA